MIRFFSFLIFLFLGCTVSAFGSKFKDLTLDGQKFKHQFAAVNGTNIHYVIGGNGKKTVILLHGFPGSWLNYKSIMGKLANAGFTVIALDLRGAGDSDIAKDGYEKKNLAIDVYELMQSIGIEKASILGHDMGTMVAYAFAKQYPQATERLIVMDSFLPGIPGWEAAYDGRPGKWHFRFFGETAEKLVAGRERIYLDQFWVGFNFPSNPSTPMDVRDELTKGYQRKGRMAAGFAFYSSWINDARDNAEFMKNPITHPILSIGGDKSRGKTLADQMLLVGIDVKVAILENTMHFPLEEKPEETERLIISFLSPTLED